jgi:hypothetical protein
MEPVYMALGQAAGAAAHLAIRNRTELHQVPRADLQLALVEAGAVVTHYNDLPFDHPAFAALQFLGARGLNPGYKATPNLKLSRKSGWIKLERLLGYMDVQWTPPGDEPDRPLVGSEVVAWLDQLGWQTPDGVAGPLSNQRLNLGQFSELVYQTYKASRSSKPIK